MGSYDIGISGLRAAQTALDIVGNNIANSSTEGYHRQDVNLSAAQDSYSSGFLVGQGVNFTGISRKINELLEKQILQQSTTMSSLSKQAESLQTIESAMGELLSDGISTALQSFYNSFEDLSSQPDDVTLQAAVVSSAQTLCSQLRNVAAVVMGLEESAYGEALSTVDTINTLAEQVALLNKTIELQTIRGYDSANLKDQRDQLVAEINELVSVDTDIDDSGRVNLSISGIPLVVGGNMYAIEAKLLPDGEDYKLAISSAGSDNNYTNIEGGVLGGLMVLRNDILDGILDNFDLLAETIITQTNDLHVQGLGSDGSFTILTSNAMSEGSVTEYDLPVEEGEFFIRITDSTGNVVRYQIQVNENSTMESIRDSIAQIPALSETSVNGGILQITAASGYTFDFLSGVLATPAPYVSLDDSALVGGGTTATAAPTIEVSGAYNGTTSQVFTCTVTATGSPQELGTGTMTLTVEDGGGTVIDTINIGAGYEAGDSIMLSNGLMISLNAKGSSSGYFNDGEVFTLSTSVLTGGGTAATAAPTIEVSGSYTGTANQTYTCTVTTAGGTQAIGTGTMTLTVKDEAGTTVASVNIGEGFTASTYTTTGTEIVLDNGLVITLGVNDLSVGYFNNGDMFSIEALADSDTSGFLCAAGLNCFFSGIDASTISVSTMIEDSAGRIATSLNADGNDNANAIRIANMGETASSALGGFSTTDFYLDLATGVGSQLSSVQLQYNNAESVYNSLTEQRDEISGVDINDQAVQMMAYQQLFQAMSQFLKTASETIQTLMTVIG